MFLNFRKPTIGLALGGGGPKGLAHIGVIKILEANHIPIDYIAGTSAGALVGGMYAAKKSLKDMEQLALSHDWKQYFFDLSYRLGLVRSAKIDLFLKEQFHDTEFDNLKIPLAVVAANIQNGEIISINKGKVWEAIRASMAIPLVFTPVRFHNKILVDGGVAEPVPVASVKKMKPDIIIAVNLSTGYFENEEQKKLGFYKTVTNTMAIMTYHLAQENIGQADCVITPDVRKVGWRKLFNKNDHQEVIKIGENAALKALPDIKKAIERKTSFCRKSIDFLQERLRLLLPSS